MVLLNDFRWHPSIIVWAEFLQLLDGDIVHIPAPKNVCSKDIEFKRDTPFFATADAPIVLVKGGSLDQMMDVRWVFFHFWMQIPKESQVELPACPKCFAQPRTQALSSGKERPWSELVTCHPDSGW